MSDWTEIEVKGSRMLVDNDDLPLLEGFAWHLADGYVRRSDPRVKGQPRPYPYVHRIVTNAQKGQVVDHINGNRLDNRKINLRRCTNMQNLHNAGKNRLNTSGYKGVTLNRTRNKWHARIGFNSKYVNLGYFDSPEEAATAYNFAAAELHGKFARYNTVPQPWLEQA